MVLSAPFSKCFLGFPVQKKKKKHGASLDLQCRWCVFTCCIIEGAICFYFAAKWKLSVVGPEALKTGAGWHQSHQDKITMRVF